MGKEGMKGITWGAERVLKGGRCWRGNDGRSGKGGWGKGGKSCFQKSTL